MYLFDVNIYVHMHREDSGEHDKVFDFTLEILRSEELFGYSPLSLSGFLRIVTHPGIFKVPTDFQTAMAFVESIEKHPNSREILPGPSHWKIFRHLCYQTKPSGNLYPDIYFAALAIDSDCTWLTCDNDYKQFSILESKIL